MVYGNSGGLALKPEVVRGWKTYNFTVEQYHTYIADGVRVHNDSILSHVEPGDELISLASNLEDAAVFRPTASGEELLILDGVQVNGSTVLTKIHTFVQANSSSFTTREIVGTPPPGLAARPIDPDGADDGSSNDLYDSLVLGGWGYWDVTSVSMPVGAVLFGGVIAGLDYVLTVRDANGDFIDFTVQDGASTLSSVVSADGTVVSTSAIAPPSEIVGTGNDDVLNGTAAPDIITGLGGNDILRSSAGADQLDGGTGVDAVYYSNAGSAVTVNLNAGTGTMGNADGDGNDRMYGGADLDTFVSTNGNWGERYHL